MTGAVPSYFVYGEPDRPLDVGFIHVETVMARKSLHLGTVDAHRHEHLSQITYWTKGHGRYFYEDHSMDFSAPAIGFMPSGVVHGFAVDPAASDAIVVSIADDALMAIRAQTVLPLDRPLFLSGPAQNPLWAGVDAILQRIDGEYRQGRFGMEKVLAALTGVVLTDIARLAHDGPAQAMGAGSLTVARQFRALVDRHFRDNWRMERYVEALGTTPHLLARACREAFGCTPKEFVNERRMLEAKRLLLFTVRPVEDIAYELGLRDAAYFSRVFKAFERLPPGQWRAARLAQETEDQPSRRP